MLEGCDKSALLIKTPMLKLQAVFYDGSVGLEFMTDDPCEAEEMREEMLAFDCCSRGRGIGGTELGHSVVSGCECLLKRLSEKQY
jgi:hypothetical protein